VIPYGRHHVTSVDALKVGLQTRFKSLTQGKKILLFEEAIAQYVGSKYAVAVSSATAGLHLATLALELYEDSEVITSPLSFVATANSILYAGNKPRFLDVRSDSLTLDFGQLGQVISPKSRAVITVHFAGLPDLPEDLQEAREKFGLRIIEDAAHSFGARYTTGEKVGSCAFSDLTVFSFHPVKSMTTGEGGVITTNDKRLYSKLLRLRSHGINKLEDKFFNHLLSETNGKINPWYYEMLDLGFNYRLTEIQAALGLSQLRRIDSYIANRNLRAARYIELLHDLDHVTPAQSVSISNSGNHIFPILVDYDKTKISRERLMTSLKSRGIGTQVHYMPIPMHPYYKNLGYTLTNLQNTLNYYFRGLSIPLFPKLSKKDQEKVVSSLAELTS
jgi:perosamine synthetase